MASHAPKKQEDTGELERKLRETIERYELIFKATNEVLYELDLRTGKVIWNDALYTQYGYSRKEKIDTLERWAEHIHPDDALRVEAEVTKWFEGDNDTWQSEYRFLKANGDYVDVRDRGFVHRADDRTPIRVIGAMQDVTHQKQLERAKDEFISLMSHQLRTPLTAIRVYSEMLTSGLLGQLDENQEKHIRHISEASIRLIRMVGDIMDVSRVESGKVTPYPVATDINKYIQNEIKEVAADKEVNVTFSPDRAIKNVLVDPAIFSQIIRNLLMNAIRYTKPQKGKIDIEFRTNEKGYLLSVKDNGIGIPKSDHRRVFDRFYRANNTVNIQEQGTGLGLYMAKQLAEAAGYDIWFESTFGKGSTFYVQIHTKSD